jgi:hypothetical protein
MRRRNRYSNFTIIAPAIASYYYGSENDEPEVEVSENLEEEINAMSEPASDLGIMANVPDDVPDDVPKGNTGGGLAGVGGGVTNERYTGGLIDDTEANKKKKTTIIIVSASLFVLGGILLYVVNR